VVTLYAGPRSEVAFAPDTPRTYSWNPHGDPRVANPDDEASRAHVVCRSDELTTQVFVEWTDVLPVATEFVLATPTLERPDDDGAPGIAEALGHRSRPWRACAEALGHRSLAPRIAASRAIAAPLIPPTTRRSKLSTRGV
jgi:hypothetical protein